MTKRATRAATQRSAAARQRNAVKRSNGAKHANGVKRANGRNDAIEHRPTYKPSRKTMGASLGSAVGGVAIYYANRLWPGMVTPEVAGVFTMAATFAVGWIVPPSAHEAIVETEHGRRTASA